jgi:hypothetical protein
MSQATPITGAAAVNLGANAFTFHGDRTEIIYRTETGGPLHPGQQPPVGGVLEYHGIEGDRTFTGDAIKLQDTPLGTLVTVTLAFHPDTGGLTVTVLIPRIIGARSPVTITTMAIKATSRGNIATPGAALTYTIIPLVGTAIDEMVPLAQDGGAQ